MLLSKGAAGAACRGPGICPELTTLCARGRCSAARQEHLFEEMGVESDKAVGADFEGARAMVQPLKKARTVLAPIRRP